ncbi:ABC transporter ATP-binding protein [Luteibacter yeojuensis]|uniref:ABC transporter ATP-binding protein n=1 Tax=Luteibacter yeojuensis TaxID=345309 RepID=A0A0F3KXA5_9GAMM|nr:ABC transporter ATP-binding protein [Luteibacter yeojuensis]KJV35791.1 ABC transporter ATP-binding protein [Luteibacter yeojuensis]
MRTPHRPPVIDMRGVGKVFVAGALELPVLTDIHLTVHEGEFVAIAGPSGCGKTTLLSLMGLLDTPTHGHMRFLGEPVVAAGRRQRALLRNAHVGFVFQAFNLVADMSVAANVALPLAFRKGIGRRERDERVAAALASVGMSHRMRHFPGQLSGGQQQRVAVARAIVGEPAVILADEPTGNLDLENGERVMALLGRLNAAGTTLCMVTHDDRFSAAADRIVRLLDGRVVDEATFQERQREAGSGLDERRAMEALL